jgi:hypothetical protein
MTHYRLEGVEKGPKVLVVPTIIKLSLHPYVFISFCKQHCIVMNFIRLIIKIIIHHFQALSKVPHDIRVTSF